MAKKLFLVVTLSCCFLSGPCYSATDTLLQGQKLKDWDCLTSSNRVFTLKFFSIGTNISPYLGIFYSRKSDESYGYRRDINVPYGMYNLFDGNKVPNGKAVWVANRNNPIPDIYGNLMIDVHGKLSISSSGRTIIDLFSPSLVTRNASATLLDSGNFVLQELYPDGSVKRVLWQSFDYPTDTLLPGMKLGINLKTGHTWSLTAWANSNLPASGSITLSADPKGTGQMVILWRRNIQWKSGPWKNGQFENTDLQSSGPGVHLYYVSNETEQSFTYLTKTYDSFPALTINSDAHLESSTLRLEVHCAREDVINNRGCVEYEFENSGCRKDYGIIDRGYGHIYGDDEYEYPESYNLTLYDCGRLCWNNCSCTAFTNATSYGTGCKTYGQIRAPPAEANDNQAIKYYVLWDYGDAKRKKRIKKVVIWLIIGMGSFTPLLSCYLVERRFHVREKAKKIKKLLLHQLRRLYNNLQTDKNMNNELHFFTFQSISSATNNFSITNKLGEGGFGAVYKGRLIDGQEVAIKRLSRSSGQGVKEFTNEIQLIAKLQHTNLVRLLGCCIEKGEKILVYEYLPNNSLDFCLFDPTKKGLLKWNNRFAIIDGIAQGLLYLHKYSRLKVIHRDLKASNILLDDCLNPKISDFGMAKLFGINESEANTSRVVGTRGYMPPEYIIEGNVSTKTDVFSFGVLLLEIVSSKMNNGSYDVEHPLSLIGLAWELWKEGRGLELVDPVLKDSCPHKEVMTCIHVGLLCVQDHAMDRPSMSEVISMLTNQYMQLPEPKRPAFFIERHEAHGAADVNLGHGSDNGQSISVAVGR